MADTAEVMAQIRRKPGVTYPVLVPNMKGLEAAIAAKATEVAGFAAATEAFSKRNTNCTIAESVQRQAEVCKAALGAGLRVRGYISVVLDCPYEGEVKPEAVAAVSQRLYDMGCYEISLGDTIGVGNPLQTRRILELFFSSGFRPEQIALHMHDTNGTALANCLVGLEMGITTFDTSIGGMGGCPYAPGAAGNLATEDLVSMLHDMGIATRIDFEKLIDAGALAQTLVGRKLTGRRLQAALGRRKPGEAREAAST
jgi:hydroxymethylglutaryl-CoA lyase